METEIDLFEQWETLPENVKAILDKYIEFDNTYEQCETMKKELELIGYTFDYYLDAEPYNLRKLTNND